MSTTNEYVCHFIGGPIDGHTTTFTVDQLPSVVFAEEEAPAPGVGAPAVGFSYRGKIRFDRKPGKKRWKYRMSAVKTEPSDLYGCSKITRSDFVYAIE